MKNRILLIAGMFCIYLLAALSFSEGIGCSISVYTDKTSYIPLERIYIYGGISDLCENAANTDVAVEIRAPDSSIIFADQIRSDENGLYSTSFVAPLSMGSGTYNIVVSCADASNTGTFEIESFFDVLAVDTDKERYVKGGMVEVEGVLMKNGAYAAGEPVAITVKDKDGNVVYVSQATTGSSGEFADRFRIAHSMQTGEYRAYAAQGHLLEMSAFKVYPSVIINEVMFYPPGDDAGEEFIELYNPYDKEADMSGWYLKSNWGAVAVLAGEDTVLAPGNFAVVISDGSTLSIPGDNLYFRAGESVLSGLSNIGGTITLFDNNGNMIDSFTYKSTYGSDRDSSSVIDTLGEGSSLERIDPYERTNYYANWDSSIGLPTPGVHNTVHAEDADVSLLFADAPRYAMAGENIHVNTRVINSGPVYGLALLEYMMDDSFAGSNAILLDPVSYEDDTYQFTSIAGDFVLNVSLLSFADTGSSEDAQITVVPAVTGGGLYSCQLLLPAIVPRNNMFQIIAVLTNDYDDDITDMTVELALPQAGGFEMADAPLKALALLKSNSFDASMVYSVRALGDIPDEILGKRTFSVYSQGIVNSEETRDAAFRTTEIIGHSSPVLSLDLNVPSGMDAGTSYELIGAAFNTGTEGTENLIITLEGEGIEVVSDKAIVIAKLEPSSFEMYSFEIMAEYSGEYEIVLTIKDQQDNSYTLRKVLNFRGADKQDDDPGKTGSSEGSSYSSSGSDSVNDAVIPADEADDAAEPDADKAYTFVEDDRRDATVRDSRDIDVDNGDAGTGKTPTGNVPGSYMTSRFVIMLLGTLLLGGLLLHFKRKTKS